MKFSSDFQGGNGRIIAQRNFDNTYEIEFIAESKAHEPQQLWFDFKLSGIEGENIRIKFANSAQCLGMAYAWSMNRPVYRINGGEWKRVEERVNFVNAERCYETWFSFSDVFGELELAFCYPYGEASLNETLSVCPAFMPSIIGYSDSGLPIKRISNSFGDDARSKIGIYIIGRQHSGEVTGSWVIDGIMRWLSSPEGSYALNNLIWWIVPFADMDGVNGGFCGKDQILGDFNRSWHEWFPNRTEVFAIEQDIAMWNKYSKGRIMLDMHSPGHDERRSYFVVKQSIPDIYRKELHEIHRELNCLLEKANIQKSEFFERPAGSNTSAQNGLSGSEYAHNIGINSTVYECSYQGEPNDKSYTIDDYRNIGASLAKALAKVYLQN